MSWETKWITEVYIRPNAASKEEVTEYLSYDLGDILGDLGGYLGLFLGWSLLSMTLFVPTILRQIWSIIILARNKKDHALKLTNL